MLRWLFKTFIWFLLCLTIWLLGLNWFIGQIPTQAQEDDRPVDAIIVLTGGSGRLDYGLTLLLKGKARALFVSGAGSGTTVNDIVQQASPDLRQWVAAQHAPLPIYLGHQAKNTIGNAEETARWIHSQHYQTIRLVTANYHLPRSINEFEEVMPGVTIIPTPVFPDDFKLEGWWNDPYSRTMMLLEYHKYLASEIRHWLVAAMRHL
jgi:uncharacterized SAM-binding protein YcdF (DUF218 family)